MATGVSGGISGLSIIEQERQVAVVVDASGSMRTGNRWKDAREGTVKIAETSLLYDPDGITRPRPGLVHAVPPRRQNGT